MFLADNGSAFYVSGAPDSRWSDDDLHTLTQTARQRLRDRHDGSGDRAVAITSTAMSKTLARSQHQSSLAATVYAGARNIGARSAARPHPRSRARRVEHGAHERDAGRCARAHSGSHGHGACELRRARRAAHLRRDRDGRVSRARLRRRARPAVPARAADARRRGTLTELVGQARHSTRTSRRARSDFRARPSASSPRSIRRRLRAR